MRKVALIFGGRSAEHEVSVISARNVFDAIDKSRYEVALIGISPDGRWWLQRGDGFPGAIARDLEVALVPGGEGEAMVWDSGGGLRRERFDVALPILHGPYGEDGTIQGVFETAALPFVGSGVLASAVCMDKDVAKRLLRDSGLPVARWLTVTRDDSVDFEAATGALGSQSLFVKPARMGSSIGVSRVDSAEGFGEALAGAFAHDRKVIVEEFVRAREIECAVLERAGGALETSWPGEIATASHHEFYTYEAKYIDGAGADLRTRADIEAAVGERIRDMAQRAFRALDCRGLARIDFFLREGGECMINEVNTMPGFTPISMFPRMMIDAGTSYPDLVSALIEQAA